MLVELARLDAVGLGGDHRSLAGGGQRFEHAFIGVERLIGDQRVGPHRRQQVIGANEVVRLATGQEEVDGVAECIGQGMDLGAQSAP